MTNYKQPETRIKCMKSGDGEKYYPQFKGRGTLGWLDIRLTYNQPTFFYTIEDCKAVIDSFLEFTEETYIKYS